MTVRSSDVLLAERLRIYRHRAALSRSELAEAASRLDPEGSISVDTIRLLESLTKPRSLPRRKGPRQRFAVESVCEALGIDYEELLRECYSAEELRASYFGYLVLKPTTRRGKSEAEESNSSLENFFSNIGQYENLDSNVIPHVRNAHGFTYLLFLEKMFPGYELAMLNDLPILFLDDLSIEKWIVEMRLSDDDAHFFHNLVVAHRTEFRQLALLGKRNYSLVVARGGMLGDLSGRNRVSALRIIDDVIDFLDSAPRFELLLLERADHLIEFEVLSSHLELPADLNSTISVMIRRDPLESGAVDYSISPMPRGALGALRGDIQRIGHHREVALQEYRERQLLTEYWGSPNHGTKQLLASLRKDLAR